ncbi:MAG TPA: acetate/propionate family kinase [Acetobacteraceae bacterium]
MIPPRAILTVNAGSSSIKFALFEWHATPRQTVHGLIENIGAIPHFIVRDGAGAVLEERRWTAEAGHEEVFAALLPWIEAHLGTARLAAVGHRVVHGGPDLTAPALLTPAMLETLDALVPLAPLHQPHSLHAIHAVTALRPQLPQVACFDTAFHRGHAPEVRRFAVPRELTEAGIERYGFHGLSYEYIASVLPPDIRRGRVVAAHLGNGASLCAMRDGRSLDSTMGFTALDGLPMGTRCGSIDPGVILHLMQARGMDAGAVEALLYRRSGLLGVSGISGDMRRLVASDDPRAAEAIALFAFHIARQTAALAATLGGLDAMVFTAGIGENTPLVRRLAAERLAWLGVALDAAANAANAPRISLPESPVAVLVVPTDEEMMIARHTVSVISG